MASLQAGLLLLLLLFIILQTVQAKSEESQCIDTMPFLDGSSGRVRPHLRAYDKQGLMLVFNDYTFNCSGLLKQWSVQIQYETRYCELIFQLHVLRPTDRPGFCGLVSMGSVSRTVVMRSRGKESLIVSVNATSDVMVEEADVIGLMILFNDSLKCERRTKVWVMEGERNMQSSNSQPVYSTSRLPSRFEIGDGLEMEEVPGFCCDQNSNSDSDTMESRNRDTASRGGSRHSNSDSDRDSSRRRSSSRSNHCSTSRSRSKRMGQDSLSFDLHRGAPLINAIIEPEVLEIESTIATKPTKRENETVEIAGTEWEVESAKNLGERQSEGISSSSLSAAIITTVGGLLAILLGTIAIIWLCYRARHQKTGVESEFNIQQNSAYSKSDGSAIKDDSKNTPEDETPGNDYLMKENTAYSANTGRSPEELSPSVSSSPSERYLTQELPAIVGYSREDVAAKSHCTLVLDGNIYEVPESL